MIQFTWDEEKNRTNIEKHGVDFVEALTVFYDDYAILINDENHSDEEDRFLLLGMSLRAKLLIVCHCYRIDDGDMTTIRIISARKATKNEIKQYEEVIR